MAGGKGDRHKAAKDGRKKQVHLWVCTKCDDAIDEDGPSIECGHCKQWCHKNCSGLASEKFKLLQKCGEEIVWKCENCRHKGTDVQDSSRLETKVDRMMEMMVALTERLLNLEKDKQGESLDEKVEAKVKQAFEELNEKNKRKLNLIVVNVPENEGENAEDRNQKDLDAVSRLVERTTDVLKSELCSSVRLGAKSIGLKPRMLRVTVSSEEAKRKILSGARKLNEGVKDPKKRIYFNQDRTPKEREDFKKLRAELEERRKEDSDLIIRGGKIVKGPNREEGKNATKKGPDSDSESE